MSYKKSEKKRMEEARKIMFNDEGTAPMQQSTTPDTGLFQGLQDMPVLVEIESDFTLVLAGVDSIKKRDDIYYKRMETGNLMPTKKPSYQISIMYSAGNGVLIEYDTPKKRDKVFNDLKALLREGKRVVRIGG